jgi:recombination protein RecA
MKRTTGKKTLSAQVKRHAESPVKKKKELDGNTETMITTGSTLLDLAISGGRVPGGGIPGGILVEIFGPSGTGKTVLLCEIAGAVQRKGGDVMFHDPEARLNKQFAAMFDLEVENIEYTTPNTVTEVFNSIQSWEPAGNLNVIVADSLAALSTDMEMDSKDGDKMGMRRAKEFSEGLRKTARIFPQKNLLMVCSNQVRENLDAGPYGQKYKAPGGEAIGFYSSLRLRMKGATKIKQKITVKGKEVSRIIGITTEIEVFKSSVDKPYRTAPVTILFDYGIDDIRENLKYVKQMTGSKVYSLNGTSLTNSLEGSIELIEEGGHEEELRQEVIQLWEEIESKFDSERKKKQR